MTPSELIERAPLAFDRAISALRSPADDPLTALLVIAGIVIVLLILVLVGLIFASDTRTIRPGSATRLNDESRTSRSGPKRRRVALLVIAVVLASAVSGWHYGVSDRACSGCHQISAAVTSHSEATHSSAPCRKCHVPPGVSGSLLARISGAGNLVGASFNESAQDTGVRNSACLRCHVEVVDGTLLARGIRMRHSDVLAVGYACTACHNTAGHGSAVTRARYPEMAQCVMCHDGVQAAGDCETCHATDVGEATREPSDLYAKAPLETDSCRGCHPMQPCIDCHGLELPHSAEFVAGFHARPGLLEPETCVKCHEIGPFCNRCHNFPIGSDGMWTSAHGYGGQGGKWHAPSPPEEDGACSCHRLDTRAYCDYCHGPQPER